MSIRGIYVPMVTPFDDNNQIDVATLKTLTQTLIDAGVHGLVVCGTTGEYYTFSDEERELVLSTVVEIAKGKVALMAGVNDLSTQGAAKKARRAQELGYESLMLAPPAYSLPSQEGIVAHYEYVAAASDLPIVMYNFPARTGISIDFDTVATLAQHPKIVGIKESSGDFSRALSMLQAKFDDFTVVCGCDDQPVDYFFWGAGAWIAGAANVFPAEQVAIFDAAQAGDWDKAKAIMSQIYPVIHSMESGDYNQKAKLGCVKGTIAVGGVRTPLANLNEADKAEFLNLLAQA